MLVRVIQLKKDIEKIRSYRPFLREHLPHSFLFKDLQRDQIESIAAVCEERQVQKDEVIFKQGDIDGTLYLIMEGSIRLEKTVENVSVEFMRLGKGESFGEIALITDLPRTASAIANIDSILLQLTREHFKHLLNQYQNLRFNVLSVVEQKLEENKKVSEQVQTLSINKRSMSPIRKRESESKLNIPTDMFKKT